MSKSSKQKESAALWYSEQEEEKWVEESRHKARYLEKYLRDIGDIKNDEAETLLNQIKILAKDLNRVLLIHRN